MKKISCVSFIIITLLTMISCNSKPKIFLEESTFNRVRSICSDIKTSTDLVIYYFDGDCSMCIAKARFIEKKLKTIGSHATPIFIAKTMNPDLLYYNLNNLKVTSCVYVEKNKEFEKTLDFEHIVKINGNREKEIYDDLVKEN